MALNFVTRLGADPSAFGASELTTDDDFLAIETSGTAFADTLAGSGGDDVISGLAGADTLSGGDGNDVLYGHSAGSSSAIDSSVLVSGLAAPVAAAATEADPGFLYIMEKDTGVIWRVNDDTGARAAFLDIPDAQFLDDGERGALGLAFHPDYASNGRFFVFLTDAQGDLQVREYHRSSNPAVAETTFQIVWETPHPQSNHNGGWIGFHPTDGYLYISTGDGGGSNDPNNNAQNRDSLLGKILRIDVDRDDFPTDANRNYGIPADNPFVGTAGADEIWAYGLRNPWRAAFDPRNGDFYIGDVGQTRREEIDFASSGEAGVNYGWRIMEGSLPHLSGPPGSPPAGDPSLRLPIYEYGRDIGTTVTGGEVYVGAMANFVGQYVFADFGSDRLFSLRMVDGVFVDGADRTGQLRGSTIPNSVVDFVTGTDGALYAVGIGGTIWRLDPGSGAEDVADTLNGGAGNDVLEGGAGADVLNGGADNDTASYASSPVAVAVNLATNTASGGDAAGDTMVSIENVTGSNWNDTLVGNSSANVLAGGAGGDLLQGGDGDDVVTGGAGQDTLAGGAGVDTADYSSSTSGVTVNLVSGAGQGGHAQDDSYGSIERVVGSAFNDVLTGRDFFADTLNGGDGDDTINGNIGADALNGGNGVDLLDYSNSFSGVDIRLFSGSASGGSANGDVYSGFENIRGSASSDTLAGDGNVNSIWGGGGNETINGREANDHLRGEDGNDTVLGGAGEDVLYGSVGADTIGGGADDDLVSYAASNAGVTVNLATGVGSGGHAQGDTLVSIEDVTGSSFDDFIIGKANFWDNVFDGGAGNDTLTGGNGDDAFVLRMGDGSDTVTDFATSGGAGFNDVVRLIGWGAAFDTFAEVMAVATQQGAHAVFNFGNGQTLTLQNVALGNLDAGDFLFA